MNLAGGAVAAELPATAPPGNRMKLEGAEVSGFVANAGTTPATAGIGSGPFWPVIDPASIRQQMRIDGSVTNERLRTAIVAAVIAVNDELDTWRTHQQAAGHATLAAVPAPVIDGTSRLQLLYERAVACATAAEVAERYRSYDATNSGDRKAEALTPNIDELRRDQRWCVRDFLGVRRVTVELI